MQSYYYTATTLHICLPGGRGYISTVFPLINALPPLWTVMGDNFRERGIAYPTTYQGSGALL